MMELDEKLEDLTAVQLHGDCFASTDVDDSLTPIICIHGLFSTSTTWSFIKHRLADITHRKVYIVDLRNHGQSEWSTTNTLRHYTADLYNFMKQREIPKAILVTHSLGGRIGMTLAIEKPEMVEKLVVEDISPFPSKAETKYRNKFLKAGKLFRGLLNRFPSSLSEIEAHKKVSAFVKNIFPEGKTIDVVLPFHKSKSGKFVFDINMESLLTVKSDSTVLNMILTEERYTGSTLFLTGTKSVVPMIDHKEKILNHFPKSNFYTFENGIHTFHQEIPEEYITVVTEFINEENCSDFKVLR